jgi:alpha-mannosidase
MTSYLAKYTDIAQSFAHAPQRYVTRLERIQSELAFAHQLCSAHSEQESDWQRRIVEAGRLMQAGLQETTVDVDDLVSQAENLLAPIGAAAKEYTLRCVSHAHIDMNWMWSWPETVAVTNDTFQTMLTLMDEFPEFIYSQSQASTYELIERYSPALFERVRQRVHEGRWEVTASQWVEGDKNMASGESISRHLLYTRAFFADRFGLAPEDVEVDFEPDTFGHPATLPTILNEGGVKYYYHCRGSTGPHLYWWLGANDSRLLVFNDVQWYMPLGSSGMSVGPRVVDALVEYAMATGLKEMLMLYGVGDHGGGPTRRDLQAIARMDAWPIFPNLQCSTLHAFFRAAEAQASRLPEITGERNFVFPGCYTSQARIKWANRRGENTLYAAEAAAVIGKRLAGVEVPHDTLDEAWRHLLFDQFHDILPGSGTRDTSNYALGRAQESQAAAAMARSNALRMLGAKIDTAALVSGLDSGGERAYKDDVESGRTMGAGVGYGAGTGGESALGAQGTSDRAFLIYNPLPYARREVVEAKLWDSQLDATQLAVSGGGLDPRPVQVLDEGRYWAHEFRTLAFPVEVPAMGYTTVLLSDRLAELGLAKEGLEDPWAGEEGSARRIAPPDRRLENDLIAAELDAASGGLVSLRDKRTGREWVPEGDLSGTFQFCVEADQGMTAWSIGQFLTCETLGDGGTLKKVVDGPYVKTFRWTRQVRASTLELEITVRQGVPRIDYRLRVDWREMGSHEDGIPHLRVCYPLTVTDPQPRFEIPFGSIQRDLLEGQEVPAQRWVDLAEPDGAGVVLANSSKYGFSVDGSALRMTLLRASIDPDPLPDLGEHTIEWSLVPHGDGWTAGQATEVGEQANVPLVVLGCGVHAGTLPGQASLVRLEQDNVRLGALKESQDGRSLILRLYEAEGKDTEARIALSPLLVGSEQGGDPASTAGVGARVEIVDTLERPAAGAAALEGTTLVVSVPAYGVITVRVG